MDAAKKADNAVRDTARTYLRKFGVNLDLEQIEKSIRDKPLPSVAIAAAAGFIIGGGMATRPAVAILALFVRKAAKETATNLMTGMVTGADASPAISQP
jgi:1,4-dihydroxy-2-naphthoyl-CoA synthase